MALNVTYETPDLNPDTFINRELSNIAFQWRVLAMAQEESFPLLERIKFLAIVGNNLDEFFMVRVGSYMHKVKLGVSRPRPDGYTPQQLLRQIREEVGTLIQVSRDMKRDLLAQLEREKIHIRRPDNLSVAERRALRQYFEQEVFPVITPLAVDHARPFPFISNLSLNLGVFLARGDEDEDDELQFARIKVPSGGVLPRLVDLNEVVRRHEGIELDGHHRIWVEDVIIDNLADLFPGMMVVEAYPFRLLRDADIDYEHEREDDDLRDVMSIIEEGVRERRFGDVVRLSVPDDISERMLERLRVGLEITMESTIYAIQGALGTADLFELSAIDRPDLKFEPYIPRIPDPLQPDMDIFSVIRRQDILLHHPYDSFSPVEDFLRAAAVDPDVLTIKATLYRVGKNSPIVQALMHARDNNKQVTVLVELKARFDEENNLVWARALESKGVHVIYGVEELPMKTHAKIALVIRREADSVRRYLHIATGNYNSSTARLYTDLALLTCNPEVADDASRLFNRLTGFAPHTVYRRLLVAPDYLHTALVNLIDNEIAAAQAGKRARIIIKVNQIEEDVIIQKLYEASRAGVEIDLMVRGLCCLRPGVPGISENIRVKSIVGRFLEHSRIFYFENAEPHQQVLVGSADVMRRNLYNRVEVVYPILDARIRQRVLRILNTSLSDNIRSWELQNDGTYVRCQPTPDEMTIDSQGLFMQNSSGLPDGL